MTIGQQLDINMLQDIFEHAGIPTQVALRMAELATVYGWDEYVEQII